jgi:glycerol-3-phosphate acyltransferase PlsY
VSFVADGDAYHFLALVLLAPVAGLILVANSLFCVFRYRSLESTWIGLVFVLVGVIGVLEAWYFLPQFKM